MTQFDPMAFVRDQRPESPVDGKTLRPGKLRDDSGSEQDMPTLGSPDWDARIKAMDPTWKPGDDELLPSHGLVTPNGVPIMATVLSQADATLRLGDPVTDPDPAWGLKGVFVEKRKRMAIYYGKGDGVYIVAVEEGEDWDTVQKWARDGAHTHTAVEVAKAFGIKVKNNTMEDFD